MISNKKQFIFIIGAPRSGTTWLHKMLAEHDCVCATPGIELTLFSDYLPPIIDRWHFELNNIKEDRWVKGLPYLWQESELNELANYFIDNVYKKLLDNNDYCTHILDKNPAYSNHVNLIDRFLPTAKFIHIIRDGRDVSISMISAKKRLGFGPDNIFDASRFWKKSILNGRHASKFGENRYFELKYEDLMAQKEELLKKIFHFCNLETNDSFVKDIIEKFDYTRSIISSPNPETKKARDQKKMLWRKAMSPIQKCIFHMTAGNLLSELNYSRCNENWWYEKKSQKIFLIFLYPMYSLFFYGGKFLKILKKFLKN